MGAHSTSTTGSKYGDPSTFNALQLDPPLRYRITPCEYPLLETDDYGKPQPAWFLPSDTPAEPLKDTIMVSNYATGYLYEPDGLSPVATKIPHFWKSTGPGETVCGPKLSHNRMGTVRHYDPQINEDFALQRLGNLLLIRNGPGATTRSRFGSGECGACPLSYLVLYGIGDDLRLTQLLDLGGDVVGGIIDGKTVENVDYEISPDWKKITKYERLMSLQDTTAEGPEPWSSWSYCWNGTAYQECGENLHATPPDPPLVEGLQSPE